MEFSELKRILQGLGVPDTQTSVGRLRDDCFCLVPGNAEGTFEAFWYERGNKHDLCVYDNESAACYGFLGLVGGGLRGRQPLAPGRGAAGAVGGVPITHRTLRSLLDGADLFSGMGEPRWARRYVVPDDFGASSGRRRLIWPDQREHPEGFASPTHRSPTRIQPGRIVDTFGTTYTRFLYDAGTSIPQRSLPIDLVESGYRRWRVLEPTPVWAGPAAPWFGLPGGANQYFTLMPTVDLVGAGFIEEIAL